MKCVLYLLLLTTSFSFGQRLTKSDKAIITNLKTTVAFLASDRLEGRRTGTPGEKLAYEYLSDQFQKIGLSPKGDNGTFLQAFEVNEGKEILPATHLSINGNSLETEKDFFPFIFSSNNEVNSFASPAIQEPNAPWFLDLKDMLDENANNPHFDLRDAIRNKAIETATKGASALFVYNTGSVDDDLKFESKSKTPGVTIPVIFLSKETAKKYLAHRTSDIDLKLNVAIGDKKRSGHNVVGFIDKGAAQTIVIGAHFDHLGYGEDHNSLWTGKPEIHNGADDNASGISAILELARMLKMSSLNHNNYLIVGFSGEELGLYGSKSFVENSPIPMASINYMINCDMVGRLNETTHSITIGGYGTSPEWSKVLPAKTKALNIKFDSSGIGPSDHTSFYLKEIPVLFFFTGTHADYHKPTDDLEKINYTGTFRIVKYIYDVIKKTDGTEKLAYLKTREPQMGGARFTVSLGVMPDYTYSGSGVHIDGIIDDRVAQKAGIKAGDVITKLGDFNVTDMNSYMTALSKFKKGDATKVYIQRAKEELVFEIVF